MGESSLFQGVTVYISGDPEKKVLDALKNGKGQMSKFTMEKATHVLCGKNFEESHVQEAKELYEIPAVTEKWILDSLKINKLVNCKAYSPGSQGKLFSNFIFAMNQIDPSDRVKLYAMITLHGGSVQKILDNKVTHLISGTAQSVALKLASLVKMTIITPDWVLDCLKNKRLIEADMYHPNLLISPLKQKITISASNDLKSPSIIRNQLQQNIRPARPMIQMQHTPQQINEIIQSQIQQQQMQEQAKRAAQAAQQSASTSNVSIAASQSTLIGPTTVATSSNENQNQGTILQVSQIQKVQTTMQQPQQQNLTQQSNTINNTTTNSNNPQTINTSNVCIIQPSQQGNLHQQNITQNQIQMNVNVQQTPNTSNNQINLQQQQRQISLQQQMETNARNQKIHLISQQLQQSTQNQQQLLVQQQQLKQFQNNQIVSGSGNNITNIQQQQQQIVVNQPQQFIANSNPQNPGSSIVQSNQMITTQSGQSQVVGQQFGNQSMKQILTPNQPQNQQFIINQNANPNIKTIGPQTTINPQSTGPQQPQTGSGTNYVQIIQQQGQQIIQIQHPDGSSQILQKNVNQTIQQQQQQPIQVSGQNISLQSNLSTTQIGQNLQTQPQQQSTQIQVPSSPSTMIPQQNIQSVQTQQTGIIQNQAGRQNIVIINQLQNPNQMTIQNQRFTTPQQNQFQKAPIGTQQIIQQKLLTSNEGIVQQQQSAQPSQIIQVHQTTLPGNQIQQQNVENIMNPQLSGNQQLPQQGPQANQTLTQAQAVQQIAQQLQSGTAEIISQQQQQPMAQGITQAQSQMNIIPTQTTTHQVGTTAGAVNSQGQIQARQWIPQSPTQQQNPVQQQPQQTPQSPIVQQTVVQQHIITANPSGAPGQQFIRASGPRIGPIYLDAQSSLQFQRMDQAQRQEYLEQLHNKQQQQQREGVMFQQRAAGPNAGPRAQHHIVIRSPVPQGLTPQQQLQWLNNQRRQILIRQPNQVGMTQINQTVPTQHANITQIQIDPNATPQQQQLQRQQHIQRLQQFHNQKLQGNQVQTPVSPRGQGFVASGAAEGVLEGIQQVPQALPTPNPNDANGVSSSKTKTALANMLSNRLGGNNGNVVAMVDGTSTGVGVVEQSAAGTLRMMTAQHNALNVQGMAPGVVRNPQELIVLQQQQQQQQIQSQMPGAQAIVQTHPQIQQRRTLGNITNAQGVGGSVVVPTSPVIVGSQMAPQIIMPQSPSTNIKAQPPFSPGRAPQIVNRPQFQFYGHNPNLKLPSELFLLGCHFLIVEYDETNAEDLSDWKLSIKHHGGEIESCYNLKVTHVLCRTQKHGIVMQAIRDNKRCVTAYWLNDIILKKQVIPPWQAIHFPSSAVFGSLRPGMKHIVSIMGFEGDERERVKRMIEESGAKLTTYLNKQNTVLVCKRLDQTNKKYLHAKEFNIPMVNVVWLSDLLLGNTSMISQFDSPKYQQFSLPQPLRIDHSILPQLMNAWKAPINLTQEAHERLKRSQLEPPVKRAKKMRTIPFLETISNEITCVRQPDANDIPIVMFSHVDNIDGLIRVVTILGGRVTADVNEMTHLVMTKPNRTIKLLNALCVAKYILSSSWLEESSKAGCFQPEENYWINDLSKANFKCDIPAVVKSPTRNKLFENRVFYITPSVKPAPSYLRWLIEKSGGKWEHNRRSVIKIHELNQQSPNSYIVVSCPEDLNLLGFKHYVCYVCTSEFILQSIMTQTMDFLKSELQLSR